ncbi:AtpZ/AtpI family protein [Patescibacteria group bacterium]|nr:AtpZ/AtpI family protein [Patescibacteria group bacterium]
MENVTNPQPKDSGLSTWQALSFAWEMGYSIAIPLVLLALGGRLLDKYLDTSPIFLLIGIVLSIIASSITAGMKAMKIINQVDKQ